MYSILLPFPGLNARLAIMIQPMSAGLRSKSKRDIQASGHAARV
jgi:hypothetical protein